ncbi:MAG: tRNA (N6-threonylcarbamoyladenosine(37)-N6)-methyltransferase TrmO [Selenomonas sp.]|uniref:tRNA (N6-threonylcarbamoyladenosine(37)-N6)-methyltransferase TrmO n=1 Tax=Selenomonas sp. TaxID=2053611 RepID=UPI0025F1ED51|nr:tRNA (N6-threonylcarbamoyladenosine(37)-N6)-methyltransferase TrmO [Selenomonas sp.]MCR5757452.1 tRNA (N6-threonylcarbamoyladenosine(37)-N6)-methyltransferase TrmO [Selenomonas sp.]
MKPIEFQPIGYIKSPFKNREDAPKYYTESGRHTATLTILPAYKDALLGVEPGMKLLMLFHFHQGTEHNLQVQKRGTGPLTGVFATRSPRRPNLIGASVIQVVKIEDTTIEFLGVDVLDGTPVLDLKLQKE